MFLLGDFHYYIYLQIVNWNEVKSCMFKKIKIKTETHSAQLNEL